MIRHSCFVIYSCSGISLFGVGAKPVVQRRKDTCKHEISDKRLIDHEAFEPGVRPDAQRCYKNCYEQRRFTKTGKRAAYYIDFFIKCY